MNDFIAALRNRTPTFTISFRCEGRPEDYLGNILLNNIDLFNMIDTMGYSVMSFGNVYTVAFRVEYVTDPFDFIAIVRNDFELMTAITAIQKTHRARVKLVYDNRRRTFNRENFHKQVMSTLTHTGVEYEESQSKGSTSWRNSILGERIIIEEIEFRYFDDSEAVNELACIVALHYESARNQCTTPRQTIEYLRNWFRTNVQYRNTDRDADHSAVGLIMNGTAVCQGIAVYAYRFLNYCGIKTRYVCGQGDGAGGWGPHAWNQVFVDGAWVHIDYTFEMNSRRQSVFVPESEFRTDHRWDDAVYSTSESTRQAHVAGVLDQTIITLVPNQQAFAINGCVACIPAIKNIAPIVRNECMISLPALLPLLNGCFHVTRTECIIFADRKKFRVPLNCFTVSNGKLLLPIKYLPQLNCKVTIEGQTISIKSKGS